MLADIESAMDLLGKTEKEEAEAARLEAEAWWKAKVDAAKFRDEVETTEKRANRWAGKEKEATAVGDVAVTSSSHGAAMIDQLQPRMCVTTTNAEPRCASCAYFT